MITDDPQAVTLYDLNGVTALALAAAVSAARYDPRSWALGGGWVWPQLVRELWMSNPVVRGQFPRPELVTTAHVTRLLHLATAARLL